MQDSILLTQMFPSTFHVSHLEKYWHNSELNYATIDESDIGTILHILEHKNREQVLYLNVKYISNLNPSTIMSGWSTLATALHADKAIVNDYIKNNNLNIWEHMTYPQIYIENLGEGNVSNTTLR